MMDSCIKNNKDGTQTLIVYYDNAKGDYDDTDEIIVLCKECFRKHGYEYSNIDKSKLH